MPAASSARRCAAATPRNRHLAAALRLRHRAGERHLIPEFDGALPDAVFVRSISAGTLEQITFRLGLLHALRESGVRVWNDARAIERCVDKSHDDVLAAQSGHPHAAHAHDAKEPSRRSLTPRTAQRELIFKPLFGSQGKGLLRVAAAERSAAGRARR